MVDFMENPIEMDDLGVTRFWETSILGHLSNGGITNTSKRWLEHDGNWAHGDFYFGVEIPTLQIFGSSSRRRNLGYQFSVTDSPPFLSCFQENLELEQLGITPWAHYFCLPCLTQQVERTQRCGVCRHPLKRLGASSRCAAIIIKWRFPKIVSPIVPTTSP